MVDDLGLLNIFQLFCLYYTLLLKFHFCSYDLFLDCYKSAFFHNCHYIVFCFVIWFWLSMLDDLGLFNIYHIYMNFLHSASNVIWEMIQKVSFFLAVVPVILIKHVWRLPTLEHIINILVHIFRTLFQK